MREHVQLLSASQNYQRSDLGQLTLGTTGTVMNCYEQVDGAAMGSPISAVVANLYMEFFEKEALNSTPVKPVLWKKYVDDTFCLVKKGGPFELWEARPKS